MSKNKDKIKAKKSKIKPKLSDPYLVVVVKAISAPCRGVTWELPKWCPADYVSILWDAESGYSGFRSWAQTAPPEFVAGGISLKKYPEFITLVDALILEWQHNFQSDAEIDWDFKGILVDTAKEWIVLDLNARKEME